MTNIRKELILAFVQKYHPSSVADLKRRLDQEGIRSTDDDLIEVVRELQSEGSITLQASSTPKSFAGFLFDPHSSWWIYLIILSSVLETLLVLENVQTGLGLAARIVFGLGLLGVMPGYAIVQILFPGDRLPFLEQALLSIFLSVMISIASGVALGAGYHFTGLSSVSALSAITIGAVLVAGFRQYSTIGPTKLNRR